MFAVIRAPRCTEHRYMNRPARFAALAGTAAVALVSAGLATTAESAPTATASASTKTVRLAGVAFSPKTTRISKGSKVRFNWQDNGIVHNVTPVGSRSFKFTVKGRTRSGTGDRTSGTITTLAFKKAGTYRYICTIHATADPDGTFSDGQMIGKIVVK